MSRYNHKKELSGKNLLYLVCMALIAITAVVYFQPREEHSHYQFDLGRPWRYNQLIATFDFPIYKSEATIRRERDSIMQFYEPYFEINEEVEETQIARFRKDFRDKLHEIVPAYYARHIEEKLHAVYRRGIADNTDYNLLLKDTIPFVRIFADNEAVVRPTAQVFSHKSAYKFLTEETDTARFNRFKLQQCNLNNYISPNLIFDKQKSETQQKDLFASLSYAKGMVFSGQKIIDRGEIVDETAYSILLSYERERGKKTNMSTQDLTTLTGQCLYTALITLCLFLYFHLFRSDYLENRRSILMLLSMVVIFPLATVFFVKHNLLSVYLIPYCMTPIFIRVFMDSRTAFITHAATVMLSAISLKYPFEFVSTQLVAGLTAIYSLRELSQRSQLLKSALIVTLSAMLFYLSLDMIHEQSLSRIDIYPYIYIFINGLLLLFAYPVMFLLEKLSGFTSNVTLVELSNINNEIMKKMSEVAPGTFQHSMQVANLAAEVANRIGAKSQLVRTGALYHDIGKTANPAFFTENQSGVNPHTNLSFTDSARIIINHVKDGLALADRYNLPPIIKDFISTHHGTGLTKYFYISYKNQFPDKPIDKSLFTYPGPNPRTLEQAILMMADAVEAASRSLKEYTEESISTLVDRIIDSQVQEGVFTKCPITFLDIDTAKEVFKEKLKIIYHTRISYPELKKGNETVAQPESQNNQTGSTSK